MNCPDCQRLVYTNQKRCDCGAWLPTKAGRGSSGAPAAPPPVVDIEPSKPELPSGYIAPYSAPQEAVQSAVDAELKKQNEYVDKYIKSHPGATVRDASMALAAERNIVKLIPPALKQSGGARR